MWALVPVRLLVGERQGSRGEIDWGIAGGEEMGRLVKGFKCIFCRSTLHNGTWLGEFRCDVDSSGLLCLRFAG